VSVTTKQQARVIAEANLSADADGLVREIERDIKTATPGQTITARAGQYTPAVRDAVADMYREAGWTVKIGSYWMELS
jgi:hypothetical protein